MKPAYTPVLLAMLCVGCAADPIDGIWQFSLNAVTTVQESCEETISHNFTFGWVEGDDEEEVEDEAWSEIEEESQSDEIFYGLITSTGPDAATLIIGPDAYPGVREADGGWTFTWTSLTTTNEQDAHSSGYSYSATADQTREDTFELMQAGEVLDGTWSAAVNSTQNWSETDSWSPKALRDHLAGSGVSGQIPSFNYLVMEDDDPKTIDVTVPVYNTADSYDCDSEPCMLNRIVNCGDSWQIDAVRTSLSTGEDYEGISGSGQNGGY